MFDLKNAQLIKILPANKKDMKPTVEVSTQGGQMNSKTRSLTKIVDDVNGKEVKRSAIIKKTIDFINEFYPDVEDTSFLN